MGRENELTMPDFHPQTVLLLPCTISDKSGNLPICEFAMTMIYSLDYREQQDFLIVVKVNDLTCSYLKRVYVTKFREVGTKCYCLDVNLIASRTLLKLIDNKCDNLNK